MLWVFAASFRPACTLRYAVLTDLSGQRTFCKYTLGDKYSRPFEKGDKGWWRQAQKWHKQTDR
jgi:hypothetical protein